MKNVQEKVTFPRKVHGDLLQKVRSKSLKYLHFFHKCCFVPNDSAVACTVHNTVLFADSISKCDHHFSTLDGFSDFAGQILTVLGPFLAY
jgi:hypothetical protein